MTDDTGTPKTKKPRVTQADRLEALRQKEAQLKAKIAAIEARQKTADRKTDTRRKIIVGAAVLAHAELDPAWAVELKAVLQKAVTRERDRETIKDLIG